METPKHSETEVPADTAESKVVTNIGMQAVAGGNTEPQRADTRREWDIQCIDRNGHLIPVQSISQNVPLTI